LHYYGLTYWSKFLSRAFEVASYFYSLLVSHPDIVTVPEGIEPQCLQLCFYYAPGGKMSEDTEENSARTAEMAKKLIVKGWMVDYAPGDRGKFFRVVVNGGTRKSTVDGFMKALEAIAGEM
jgi:glutamate decarboxylase